MFERLLVTAAAAAALGIGMNLPGEARAQAPRSGHISVNRVEMYYEVHGEGRPLVLLHGALMTIETFGDLLPSLARTRQVIAIEQQAHGRTADIDRPLSYEQMADDTAELLRRLGIEEADFYGYSMGGGIAMQVAIRHPGLVRRLVLAAAAYSNEGVYPEVLEGIEAMKAEDFVGSPWHEAYLSVAPDPDDWATLIQRIRRLDMTFEGWAPEDIRAIEAPTLIIIGDSDIVRPEHTVEMFRLLGGGVPGDLVDMPRARLAVLPGTTHVTILNRVDWVLSMVTEFLDAPMPDPE